MGSHLVREQIWQILRSTGWAPLLVLILHVVLAELFGHEPIVDPFMHFAGGIAAAYFFRYACAVSEKLIGQLSRFGLDVMSFSLTCAIALCWEFGEFLSDTFLGTTIQISVANTMRDLILGTIGSLVFIGIRRYRN